MRSSISSIVFKCSCLAFIEAQLVNTCCRAGSNLCAPRAIVPRSGIALTVLGEKDLIMKPKTETLTMDQLIELIEANKKKRIKEINQLKKIYYPY